MDGLSHKLDLNTLKIFLDEKADLYEQPKFIGTDPIQIPHLFSKKEDREVMAFLMATIAWGNRKSIITNGERLVRLLDQEPFRFVMDHSKKDLEPLKNFVHRTFNGEDLITFINGLRHIYTNCGGMENVFNAYSEKGSLQKSIHQFKNHFFEIPHLHRTQKHISDPYKKSAAKRINMFLRWMVRPNNKGVDFGIWQSLSPAQLSCPLDVHSGRIARELGLLKRKQNDAFAVAELDQSLRQFDPNDPVKYDYALFGLSAFEKEIF